MHPRRIRFPHPIAERDYAEKKFPSDAKNLRLLIIDQTMMDMHYLLFIGGGVDDECR